jgi:hypothetical protein
LSMVKIAKWHRADQPIVVQIQVLRGRLETTKWFRTIDCPTTADWLDGISNVHYDKGFYHRNRDGRRSSCP